MKSRLDILEDEMLRREEYESILQSCMRSILELLKTREKKVDNIYVIYCDSKSKIIISPYPPSNNFHNCFEGCDSFTFAFHDENECRAVFNKDIISWLRKAYPYCKLFSSSCRIHEFDSETVLVFHYNINNG